MYNIKTLNKISACGLEQFDAAKFNVSEDVDSPDAVLVRSASMHETPLDENLLAIARAGAGTNNIPVEACGKQGIVVFNTPGANANAVKELAIAGLLMSSRKICQSIDWAKTIKSEGDAVPKLVEKGKSAFGGPEILGKNLGIIGLGAIGVMVANIAVSLGMNVYGFDPFISVDNAWDLKANVIHTDSLDEIYENCHYISLHAPLNDDTRGMVNAESINKMMDEVRILNFSRADLANNDHLLKALTNGKVGAYVTDFPTADLIDVDGVIAIPHLGASTPESEDNCAGMAAAEIIDFLTNGNIKNSVNMPNVSMARGKHPRVTVIHDNIPNIIAQISSTFSANNVNIESIQSASRGDVAYSMFDVSGNVCDDSIAKIASVDGIRRVRLI